MNLRIASVQIHLRPRRWMGIHSLPVLTKCINFTSAFSRASFSVFSYSTYSPSNIHRSLARAVL